MTKRAIVLMNLGGPDSADAVAPFLYNLFSDPAIVAVPNPLRWFIATLIARQRAPIAREIFAKIGNASPLLANTKAQGAALEAALGGETRAFIAMRYWKPFAAEAVSAVSAWQPDEIVLLPLYPQFSTTTTASSFADWDREAARAGLRVAPRRVRSYPREPGFIAAIVERIEAALAGWPAAETPPRILLSAHGLPKRIVARGDPYPRQVEETAAAIKAKLARPGLELVTCYQSRVGPLEWIGPATDAEIKRAGADRLGLIVAPIAFVSEHSETLVELDIDYRKLAAESGVPRYVRVPTAGTAAPFIAGLARLVEAAT